MNQGTQASKVQTLALKVLGNLVQIAGSLASFACLAMVKVYEVHFATVQASAKDSCNTYTLYIIQVIGQIAAVAAKVPQLLELTSTFKSIPITQIALSFGALSLGSSPYSGVKDLYCFGTIASTNALTEASMNDYQSHQITRVQADHFTFLLS